MSIWGWLAIIFTVLYVMLGLAAHIWRYWDGWRRTVGQVLRAVGKGLKIAGHETGLWLLGGLLQFVTWCIITAVMLLMIVVLVVAFAGVALGVAASALIGLAKLGRDLVYRLTRKNGKSI